MNLFHRHDKKNDCTQCKETFDTHEDLVKHVRHNHHKTIVRCSICSDEFIHEKDRLHHERAEHKKILENRSHRESYPGEYTQEKVDRTTHHFSDEL